MAFPDSGEVLVNDRCLYRGGTGISTYLRNLLAHWPPDARLRPVCFCAAHPRIAGLIKPPAPANVTLSFRSLRDLITSRDKGASTPAWTRRLMLKTYATAFRAAFRKGRYAVYFEPNNLAMRCPGPMVTTVHDLSVLEHPEWHPPARVRQWQSDLDESLSATDRWTVPSRFTRDRMVRLLGVGRERVAVIPLAGRPLPYPDQEQLATARAKVGLPARYFLYLGNLEPRKNVVTALEAYGRLPAELRAACSLILAGPCAWGDTEFWDELCRHPMAGEALAAGYASDDQTALLLAGATALVMPSRYEGFGLPLLEAMRCGTPVLCSTVEAFREVAEEAAVFIHPDDPDAWTAAMRRLLEDADWRRQLSRAGRLRAQEFSWEETASRHLEVFEEAALASLR